SGEGRVGEKGKIRGGGDFLKKKNKKKRKRGDKKKKKCKVWRGRDREDRVVRMCGGEACKLETLVRSSAAKRSLCWREDVAQVVTARVSRVLCDGILRSCTETASADALSAQLDRILFLTALSDSIMSRACQNASFVCFFFFFKQKTAYEIGQ